MIPINEVAAALTDRSFRSGVSINDLAALGVEEFHDWSTWIRLEWTRMFKEQRQVSLGELVRVAARSDTPPAFRDYVCRLGEQRVLTKV